MNYEMRFNNAAVKGVCRCGDWFKPSWGPWPFVPGTWEALCESCASGKDVTTPEARAELERQEREFMAAFR